MRSAPPQVPSDCWPTPEQELLLKAALGTGDHVREAWMRWRKGKDLPTFPWDAASYRLMPLLARNLSRQGVIDPFLPRLRRAQRHHWFRNQTLLAGLADIVRLLQDQGCGVIVLKGAALALSRYEGLGDRPMDDIDVLVRTRDFGSAMDTLRRHGWRTTARQTPPFLAHSFLLTDASGMACDLHRHLLHEWSAQDEDELSWADAGTLRFAGVEVGILNDADQLLHTCVHGVRWNDSVAPLRWVADALHILRHPETNVDWSRLLQRASTHFMVGLSLSGALGYLHERFDVAIPGDVLQALRLATFSEKDRVVFARYLRPRAALGAREWYRFIRADFELIAPGGGRWARLAGFARYLQNTWRLPSVFLVPPRLAFAAVRALARRPFRD